MHNGGLIRTKFEILHPDGKVEFREIDWPHAPGYHLIKAALDDYFKPPTNFEHVNILDDNGEYSDMFVDDMGLLKGLMRNEEATRLYRQNWLKQHPTTNPESLSHIAGIAVVTDRKVWF